MDKLKKMINEIVDKVKNDKDFANNFKSNPIKAVESVLGVDLPDDQIEKVVDGVKAKISLDSAGDLLSKAKGLLK